MPSLWIAAAVERRCEDPASWRQRWVYARQAIAYELWRMGDADLDWVAASAWRPALHRQCSRDFVLGQQSRPRFSMPFVLDALQHFGDGLIGGVVDAEQFR